MQETKSLQIAKTVLTLSIAGVLFSGYLSGVKLLTDTCAFNESCPYFLGYPACWYGFGMYLLVFLAALIGTIDQSVRRGAFGMVRFVAFIGILFAGYMTRQEVGAAGVEDYFAFALGLPTCVYGLLMFVVIFILSWRLLTYIAAE